MSTLAILKAQIADDLARGDLATQIASAINAAIADFQKERFFFNVSRQTTFATVIGQAVYVTADDADIPLFLEVDAVFCTDASGQRDELEPASPAELEYLITNSAPATSQPSSYARYADGFLLYPVPDAVYTILPMGHIEVAAPATDGEASNPWMIKAYELIRCRAKEYLFTHVIRDELQRQQMERAVGRALSTLRDVTSRKTGTGRIVATTF